MAEKQDDGETKGRRRGPRKVTEKRLENVALYYLGRFSASADSLRKVLMRRVRASAQAHGTDPEEGAAWVEALIVKFVGLGYLDDRKFAETRAKSLLARGVSTRGIRGRLREKGIAAEIIDSVIETMSETGADLDLAAAVALARRRRLGPFRAPDTRQELREKDLAALARVGFSYGVARRVIEAESTDELDEWLAAPND